MAKTLLDLDESLLAEATSALGTGTKRETVTRALELAVADARARRAHALADLQRLAEAGALDFDRLPELDD